MSVVDSLFGMGTIFDMVQDRGYLDVRIIMLLIWVKGDIRIDLYAL